MCLGVTDPSREQHHESHCTAADRSDQSPVFAVAAELARGDGFHKNIANLAIALARIATDDEDY